MAVKLPRKTVCDPFPLLEVVVVAAVVVVLVADQGEQA